MVDYGKIYRAVQVEAEQKSKTQGLHESNQPCCDTRVDNQAIESLEDFLQRNPCIFQRLAWWADERPKMLPITVFFIIASLSFGTLRVAWYGGSSNLVISVALLSVSLAAYLFVNLVLRKAAASPMWEVADNSRPRDSTYCVRCERYRAAGAHHCSRCGHCVDGLDHHCLWLTNCVGNSNFRNFTVMLGYFFVLAIWALKITWWYFLGGVRRSNDYSAPTLSMMYFMFNTFIGIISLSGAGYLFFRCIYFAVTGLTTLDFLPPKPSAGQLGANSDGSETSTLLRSPSSPKYDKGKSKITKYLENWQQRYGVRGNVWLFVLFHSWIPKFESPTDLPILFKKWLEANEKKSTCN